MKILQVSNRVPWPLNEGGNIGIYNYTRAFHRLGHEVYLYCLDGLKHNTPVAEAQAELSKFAHTYIHPIDTGIKTDEALKHLLRNESYNVSRFYNRAFEMELEELLKNNTFDVVQLEGTFAGPYIETVRQNHSGMLSLRMHNAEFEIWERLATNASNPAKKIYLNILAKQLKKYEKRIVQEVDVIVPVTDNDGEKFKSLAPSISSHTTPAGIDLDEWQYHPAHTFLNWYHIGSMEWHANVEAVDWYIKDIHPKLLKQSSDYTLHLAGKSIDAELYDANRSVLVASDVPRAFDFVKVCDVCVVPLKSGSGIRLKILEAMAAGKLVVSTTIGAQGIDYIANEHLLIADTPDEFVACFKAINNGDIDAQKIIQNARQLIENRYATEALADELLKFYQA